MQVKAVVHQGGGAEAGHCAIYCQHRTQGCSKQATNSEERVGHAAAASFCARASDEVVQPATKGEVARQTAALLLYLSGILDLC